MDNEPKPPGTSSDNGPQRSSAGQRLDQLIAGAQRLGTAAEQKVRDAAEAGVPKANTFLRTAGRGIVGRLRTTAQPDGTPPGDRLRMRLSKPATLGASIAAAIIILVLYKTMTHRPTDLPARTGQSSGSAQPQEDHAGLSSTATAAAIAADNPAATPEEIAKRAVDQTTDALRRLIPKVAELSADLNLKGSEEWGGPTVARNLDRDNHIADELQSEVAAAFKPIDQLTVTPRPPAGTFRVAGMTYRVDGDSYFVDNKAVAIPSKYAPIYLRDRAGPNQVVLVGDFTFTGNIAGTNAFGATVNVEGYACDPGYSDQLLTTYALAGTETLRAFKAKIEMTRPAVNSLSFPGSTLDGKASAYKELFESLFGVDSLDKKSGSVHGKEAGTAKGDG